MSKSSLPERASLEFLKKRAKERLAELRRTDPRTKLAAAQLEIAREYGFTSWRALKTEIDARRAPELTRFFEACAAGEVATLRALLASEPGLARERTPDGGTTGLHLAIPHLAAVRLLLEHGADPNARDVGDNATPLHGAGRGGVDVVRALLDAGADVHGFGDLHQLEVIGWATCFGPGLDRAVVDLLLERGARHHIFSAIACHDLEALQRLVEDTPDALSRRLSRFEGRQSALHYVIAPPDGLLGGSFRTGSHYDVLDLLIELGADLEAEDDQGRTPQAIAMLRGDEPAMRRLKAAGAREPRMTTSNDVGDQLMAATARVQRSDVMIAVPDVRATVEWYQSIGFHLEGAHEIDTSEAWAGLSLGKCFIMFVPSGPRSEPHDRRDVSLWLRTDRVDDLYQVLKQRQMERASDVLAGRAPRIPETRFQQDIHNAFYGERQFTVIDPNGYELTFCQAIPQQA
jgi:ankyrin repeat protein/catechol 2,3-dioxygenase-like lactoylglutathione lyase family enzyme